MSRLPLAVAGLDDHAALVDTAAQGFVAREPFWCDEFWRGQVDRRAVAEDPHLRDHAPFALRVASTRIS